MHGCATAPQQPVFGISAIRSLHDLCDESRGFAHVFLALNTKGIHQLGQASRLNHLLQSLTGHRARQEEAQLVKQAAQRPL